tara:strand:+ start:1310 stop:1921 length:612 start_codon:yes stop_codon:yes gene_type:complete
MLPSSKELKEYFFAHPIAGSVIAFAAVEAIKTIWESVTNPKGQSPFSTYDDVRSGYIVDTLGHITGNQKKELDAITDELYAASKKHAGQADRIKQLGSTSTTTSTSSAHGGNQRTPTGSTWDKHSMPGEKMEMFGIGNSIDVISGPPSVRRRVSVNSYSLGGLTEAPQKIETPKIAGLPVTRHFDVPGMVLEQEEEDDMEVYV